MACSCDEDCQNQEKQMKSDLVRAPRWLSATESLLCPSRHLSGGLLSGESKPEDVAWGQPDTGEGLVLHHSRAMSWPCTH